MYGGPTANFVAGQLVACYEDSCEKYDDNDNSWTKIADTRSPRQYHSSAQHEDRILLIGGRYSSSTEWISTNGGEPQIGLDCKTWRATLHHPSLLRPHRGYRRRRLLGLRDGIPADRRRHRDRDDVVDQREMDSRVWCLPGGRRSTGEDQLVIMIKILVKGFK